MKNEFITVKNKKGMEVILSTLGAGLYSIKIDGLEMLVTPKNEDVYLKNDSYFGKTVGRFSGRIANAKCEIEGVTYMLEKNWNGVNALHGGSKGASFLDFTYDRIDGKEYTDVVFSIKEKGKYLPGDVTYVILYRIMSDENKILIGFGATSTKKTVLNLTNHSYFNLGGCKDTILNCDLYLNCEKYTDLDENLITKKIVAVSDNKVMDFSEPHKIGDFIEDPYLQNHTSFGYDHTFIKENDNPLIASLINNESKIGLNVYTSYPCVVVYTDNYPLETELLQGGENRRYLGVTFETQYIPNGINMSDEYALDELNEFCIYEFIKLK